MSDTDPKDAQPDDQPAVATEPADQALDEVAPPPPPPPYVQEPAANAGVLPPNAQAPPPPAGRLLLPPNIADIGLQLRRLDTEFIGLRHRFHQIDRAASRFVATRAQPYVPGVGRDALEDMRLLTTRVADFEEALPIHAAARLQWAEDARAARALATEEQVAAFGGEFERWEESAELVDVILDLLHPDGELAVDHGGRGSAWR